MFRIDRLNIIHCVFYVILNMASSTQDSDREVWRGRPWITPYVVVRTIFLTIIASGVLYLESSMNIIYRNVSSYDIQLLFLTIIAFLIIWFIWELNLLVLRATNLYVLREDSLEIKTGLLTTKTSVIVPTGFSDLELIRSITSRIYGTGDIMIKIQSERDFTKRMIKVRDPTRVANMIRNVMARQFVRLDEGEITKK